MISGEITEVYVGKLQRRTGLGKKLMEKAEAFLKSKGCEYAKFWVFEPNTGAHNFYRATGYQDRNILMLKKL